MKYDANASIFGPGLIMLALLLEMKMGSMIKLQEKFIESFLNFRQPELAF